jgi:hypothetical protein
MKINWAEESKSKGGLYPENIYKVRVVTWQERDARTGTPQIQWQGEILENDDYQGSLITIYTALTEKSLWKIAKLISACGIDLQNYPEMEIGSAEFFNILNSCIGKVTLWQVVIERDKNNNKKNVVEFYYRDGAS